jgi:hypothetical protein
MTLTGWAVPDTGFSESVPIIWPENLRVWQRTEVVRVLVRHPQYGERLSKQCQERTHPLGVRHTPGFPSGMVVSLRACRSFAEQ